MGFPTQTKSWSCFHRAFQKPHNTLCVLCQGMFSSVSSEITLEAFPFCGCHQINKRIESNWVYMSVQNHKLILVGRTFKGHLVQTPCNRQGWGNLPIMYVNKEHITLSGAEGTLLSHDLNPNVLLSCSFTTLCPVVINWITQLIPSVFLVIPPVGDMLWMYFLASLMLFGVTGTSLSCCQTFIRLEKPMILKWSSGLRSWRIVKRASLV